MREHDLAIYKALGDRGTEITGYPNISVYHDFAYDTKKYITGAFDDWAYDYYGVFAFTIEFWSMARASGVEVDDFIEFARHPPEEAALKMLAWNDRELNGEGFVPWKPFDHPQLGRVEVGGWKTKFTFQNPPPKYLEGRVREAGPLRPLPRFHGPPPEDQPRNRTALAGPPTHRTRRREHGLPADKHNKCGRRQKTRQARTGNPRATTGREPDLRPAGGGSRPPRGTLRAHRQQVEEPTLLPGPTLRLRQPKGLDRTRRRPRRNRSPRRKGRNGTPRNRLGFQQFAQFTSTTQAAIQPSSVLT